MENTTYRPHIKSQILLKAVHLQTTTETAQQCEKIFTAQLSALSGSPRSYLDTEEIMTFQNVRCANGCRSSDLGYCTYTMKFLVLQFIRLSPSNLRNTFKQVFHQLFFSSYEIPFNVLVQVLLLLRDLCALRFQTNAVYKLAKYK